MAATNWSLATIATPTGAIACIEAGDKLYALPPSLARVGMPGVTGVIDLFADWDVSLAALDRAAGQLSAADVVAGGRLSPLLYPGKVMCAGANYFDHLAEMGMPGAKKADQRLFFFMKPARNAVVGEGDTVCMPIGTQAFDWEIELAVVIGKRARNVTVADAMTHVAGYTVAIDFSARDHNRAAETFYKLDWVAGKANDTCCPLGPRFVPARAIANPQDIGLKLAVNGATKQDGRSTDMIFSIAEVVSFISQTCTLIPGDLICTGTPSGVAMGRSQPSACSQISGLPFRLDW